MHDIQKTLDSLDLVIDDVNRMQPAAMLASRAVREAREHLNEARDRLYALAQDAGHYTVTRSDGSTVRVTIPED